MLREGLHNALGSRLLAGGTVREGAGRRVALRVDVYIELVLRAGDPALDALGADGEGPAAHLWEGWGYEGGSVLAFKWEIIAGRESGRLKLGRRVVRLDGELLATAERGAESKGEGVTAAGAGPPATVIPPSAW